MKDKIIPVLMVLGLSMFCVIVVLAIGLGSWITPINRIAGPIVCGNQQLTIEQNNYRYLPGERTTIITAYCVDKQTGAKQDVTAMLTDVTTKIQLTSGTIYGLILFVLAMLFLNWAAHSLNKSFAELFQPSVRRT